MNINLFEKYNIIVIRKDIKNFILRIKNNLEISLSVPLSATDEDINKFLSNKEYWIQREINKFNPEDYVKAISLDREITPILLRKLKNIAQLIDEATEIEDFQSIGVQCREILIELGNSIYKPEMATSEEQPQKSNFKKKAELFVNYCLEGSENSDYRNYIKKLQKLHGIIQIRLLILKIQLIMMSQFV